MQTVLVRSDDDDGRVYGVEKSVREQSGIKDSCYSGYTKENTVILTGLTLDLSPVVGSMRVLFIAI